MARGGSLARERDLLSGAGERAADLQTALADAGERYLVVARELSRARRDAAGRFGRTVEGLLAELAMERTRFEVHFNITDLSPDEWSERGIDRAEFYVSPNPGEDLRPLARIVSGGELSRVMLALKTLTVGDAPGKTLIFDEVDAGIGGRVAEVVGGRLRGLGDRFQVLCITHLAQIAARGTTQFRIEKQVRAGRTSTSVERLNEAGRVEEISRMIGGAVVTDAVRATARDLIAGGTGDAVPPYVPAGPLRGTRPTDVAKAKGEGAKGESPRARKRK